MFTLRAFLWKSGFSEISSTTWTLEKLGEKGWDALWMHCR
jgi:hypothetical protein